jgi:thiol-disulfide isomerase/thioredoxin
MVRCFVASVALFVAAFSQAAVGSEIVLLDFTSPFCGPCQQMAPTIEKLTGAGYPIRKIDVTREPQVAAQFNVPRVPTFILLIDGQVFDRIEGSTSGQMLEAMFHRARRETQRRDQERIRTQSPDQPPPTIPWTSTGDLRQEGTKTESTDSANSGTIRTIALETRAGDTAARPTNVNSLLNASVRLRVDDAKGRAYGTGTIIDSREDQALIITCGHLFRESKGKATVVVDLFEATPQGARSTAQITGRVISYDLERDVALVAIWPGRPVGVAPIAPPRTAIQRGDRVVSVGCNNGQDPTLLAARITSLDRYQGPPNIEASGAPVEGRSGGGLFNQDGQLIGVCFAADYEGNEGLYAALQAIHDELNYRGLGAIAASTDRVHVADGIESRRLSAAGPIVRGQEPVESAMPPAAQRTNADETGRQAAIQPASIAGSPLPRLQPSSDLSPTEQAAWEEISARAATSEVICIIRPKQPGGQSEVITLGDVSPEFVRALANLQRDSQTGLHR